jgi:hypothetical protein
MENDIKSVTDDPQFDINFEALGKSETPGKETESKEPQAIGEISPDLAIYLIDAFISRSVQMGAKIAGYEVKYSDISLNATEIKRIRPLAKKALEKFMAYMNEKFPEYFALFLVLLVTYGGKTMATAKKIDKNAVKKAAETPVKKPVVKRIRRTSKIKE